ncbi:MAG: TolC family protein [Candidatus Sericytochromatia bacterium]
MSNRFIRRQAPGALVLAALSLPILASAAGAETFSEAAAVTLKAHPMLQADAAQVRAASEAIATARSGYFPHLSLDTELNSDTYTREVGSVGLMGRQAGIQVQQMLFDGQTTNNRVEGANALHDVQNAERMGDQNQLLLAVARVYVGVLRERDALTAAKRNLTYHQQSVATLKAIVKHDAGKGFDLTQIQAREALAASNVQEREAALRAAEASFVEIVGHAPTDLVTPEALAGAEFKSLEEALRVGQAEHPAVKAAGHRARLREAEHGEARSSLVPRFDATARFVKGMDRQSLAGQNDNAYAGLRGSYALPTGGANAARAKSAEILVESANHKVEAARRDIRESIRVAWAQREGLAATLPMATEHWTRINEVVAGFKTQYSLGRRTVLDLLIVQNESYTAETRKIQIHYDRLLADYALAANAGTLVARFTPPDDTPIQPKIRLEQADQTPPRVSTGATP